MRCEYQIIETLSKKYPVKVLCELMSINRSGYYKWLARKDQPNRYEQDRQMLTQLLAAAHKQHSTYGYHNLAALVRQETGWVFSDNLAHKCCKFARIRSSARRTYHYTKGMEHNKYPNLVAGQWNASRPMELIVSDMTILKNKYVGKIEWTYVLDTYNNEIIASALSRREGDPQPYLDCITTIANKTKEQTHPVTFHTDQGSVYSSKAFRNAHSHCTNIIRSMSRVGTPTDNPIIEALNGWIKAELYNDFGLYRSHNVHKLIDDYIYYFNHHRFSVKCGRKSPVQFRTEQGFG